MNTEQQDTTTAAIPPGAPPANARGGRRKAAANGASSTTTARAAKVPRQARKQAPPSILLPAAQADAPEAMTQADGIPASSRTVIASMEAQFARARSIGERLVQMNQQFLAGLPEGKAEEVALRQYTRHLDKLEASIQTLALAE